MLNMPAAPRRQQIPHRIAHDVAILGPHAHPLLARQKEVRLRLCAQDVAAFDHNGGAVDPQRVQRGVDLRSIPRSGDAEQDAGGSQVLQQLHRAGERPAVGHELREDFAMAVLQTFRFRHAQIAAQLAPAARVKSPPLIPMRRWMRQPSTGKPASQNARCHEKTCA